MKKLLIFGGGFVGGQLASLASPDHQVLLAYSQHFPSLGAKVEWRQVDITNQELVAGYVPKMQSVLGNNSCHPIMSRQDGSMRRNSFDSAFDLCSFDPACSADPQL